MSPHIRPLAFALALLWLVVLSAPAQQPSEEEQFLAQARKLAPRHPKATRLAALRWLQDGCARPAAVKTMPALERCIRQDPDADVRLRAVEALALTAFQQKPRLCPVVVVGAVLDRDADVRSIAQACASLFREFAPGSVDVMLKAARHEDPYVRGQALLLLEMAAGMDEKVQQVIQEGRQDRDFRVRNDAHIAWFRITNKLEDILPYSLRFLVEFQDEPPLPANATKQANTERCVKNLIQLGIAWRFLNLGEVQVDEVALALLTHLEDRSPVLRRGAVLSIGMLVPTVEVLPRRPLFVAPNPADIGLPIQPPAKDEPELLAQPPRPEEGKLLLRLRELKVERRLQKVQLSDADEKVRTAAGAALEKLTLGKQ